MVASDRSLVVQIRRELRDVADPDRAPRMQAYMKSAMPFLGVVLPEVRRLSRAAERAHPFPSATHVERAVRALWDGAEFREERYAATAPLDTLSARARRAPGLLALHHDLIVDGAWWDHVDDLAHRVGELLRGWPDEIRPRVRAWIRADDRWLRRVAIICQLGHRDDTDRELLLEAVAANAADTEFFVRKAIGWALRDLARSDPDWVRTVVATHDLSPLSRREALKHL